MSCSAPVAVAVLALVLIGPAGAQQAPTPSVPEATSLLGTPLFWSDPHPDVKARLEADLAGAQAAFDRDPTNADAIIWLGRRLAYLGRYRDAIATFTTGIALHPGDARLYRHRGHRYITVRELDRAVADLEKAAALIRDTQDAIEPDGQPNRLNTPTSTLHFNVWYHLGLARYLKGDFESALHAYREGMKVSTSNDDARCATSDWLYMTLRRLGREEEAGVVLEPIHERMTIIENESYHRRLLMYKGVVAPDALLDTSADDLTVATQGYGVANWYFYTGQREKAIALFEQVVAGRNWAAFGYIAAEADLARLRR
jgi:tetratricopeptide (TPR) repeat protein